MSRGPIADYDADWAFCARQGASETQTLGSADPETKQRYHYSMKAQERLRWFPGGSVIGSGKVQDVELKARILRFHIPWAMCRYSKQEWSPYNPCT